VQIVEMDVAEDLPKVNADTSRIAQVLGNMLTNAGKFSPETASISISVEADADVVTVQVRDRGRGIRPERPPHLFKKFSQVHDDGRRRLSGVAWVWPFARASSRPMGGGYGRRVTGRARARHSLSRCRSLPGRKRPNRRPVEEPRTWGAYPDSSGRF
jgi:signal transduction histidine kinase